MFLYIIRSGDTNKYKIGISKDPKQRLEALQTGNGETLEIVHTFPTRYDYKLEAGLHNSYKSKKTIGEWFEFSEKELSEVKNRCVILETTYTSLEESGNPFI